MRFPPAVVHEADVRPGVVGADRREGEGEQLLRVEVPPRPPVVVVVALVPTDQLVVVPGKNVNLVAKFIFNLGDFHSGKRQLL
jgi:hypothetical protein